MKKFLTLTMAALLSACATHQDEEVITEPEVVTTEKVVYRDYDTTRIYQEDLGARQYVDAGRRRVRVIRTTPVENYEPETTIVENSYQPTYSESNYRRTRRIMDDETAPRRVYNRPRYTEQTTYTTGNAASETRPCRRRARVTSGYRTVESSAKGCPDEIRETREPVEILYKKTTYKTVYEPKTYTDVSYEKEPYRAGMIEDVRTLPSSGDTVVETTTTTTTVSD